MRSVFLLGWIVGVIPLLGEEAPLPGHSAHGDVFNEGPRQAAVLMDGMGKVNFPVSTKSAEAQRFFNQGVGQLHGFWYYEAERSFRQVAKLDPDCAMALWGCAMANVNNETRAKGFIAEAIKKRDKATPREQKWIDALNRFYDSNKRESKERHQGFIEDLETIVQEHPEDLEASAFLGWAIWKAKDGGVPMVSREAVDGILKGVLAKEPTHPVNHYRIHLWDTGKAKLALNSAATCGQSAPGIAHMWHMPAHTYTKTNRGADSAWAQEAALRVDHAYIARARVLADQIHNYAHNAEWLIRVWNEQGQVRDSVELAKNLLSMPRHPVGNILEKQNSAASYGRTRLLETLLKFELWDEVLALEGSPLLDVTLNRSHEAARLRAMGVAAYFKGDGERLAKSVALLTSLQKTTPKAKPEPAAAAAAAAKKEKDKGNEKAKEKDKGKGKDNETAGKDKKDGKPKVLEPTAEEIALAELKAVQMLMTVSDKTKPACMKALEALKNVPDDRMARYFLKAGNTDKAVELANKLPNDAAGQALKVEILMAAGKREDAQKALVKAGEVAPLMAADVPFAGKLDAAATELEMKDGWRKVAKDDADKDEDKKVARPTLDSLGPVHWAPVMAEEIQVKDAEGKSVDGKAAVMEKPVLVFFYLSGECTHCVSQLKAFHAAAAKFKAAGVELVAVGYEKPEELARTVKLVSGAGEPGMKFLADEELNAFKAWGCHDDFENSALHGTFLIDGKGQVRWQDIGYQPFDNVTFLLAEAKRLLGLP